MNQIISVRKKIISEDGTIKLLISLADDILVETVLMKHDYGNSVCVSSQAGCNMGCIFCASGRVKKKRNLTAEEMMAQVDTVSKECCEEPLSHIVVMGVGEPFDNYDETIRFCEMASDIVAPRHITVSTCGLVPEIRKFATTEKRYNLAISLHAAKNELRSKLMPVNNIYPIEEVVDAALEYCKITKRRVAFEYILLSGVNDDVCDACELAALLKPLGEDCYVNLIPFNKAAGDISFFAERADMTAKKSSSEDEQIWTSKKGKEEKLKQLSEDGRALISGGEEEEKSETNKKRALEFYDCLMKHGIKATLRKKRGQDIQAACGQLLSR